MIINGWHDAKKNPPEFQNEYLVNWTAKLGGKKVSKLFYEICEWTEEEGWITSEIEQRGYTDVEVVAWMFLPEPFDGKEHSCQTCIHPVCFAGTCDSCIGNKSDCWMDGEKGSLALIHAYQEAKKRDKTGKEIISFQCPICLGVAKGATEKSMGHIRIVCEKCGTKIIS